MTKNELPFEKYTPIQNANLPERLTKYCLSINFTECEALFAYMHTLPDAEVENNIFRHFGITYKEVDEKLRSVMCAESIHEYESTRSKGTESLGFDINDTRGSSSRRRLRRR